MTAANFASYTRSTAFSVSLSAKMIDRLLNLWKITEVAARYDWWTPPLDPFATGPASTNNGTDSALIRRGLAEVDPDRVQRFANHRCEPIVRPVLQLTHPGNLMAELLLAAAFPLPTRHFGIPFNGGIEAHPDDCDHLGGRHEARMIWTHVEAEPEFEQIDLPSDRRLDLWQPGDEHYYGHMAIKDKRKLDAMVLGRERAGLVETEPAE